MCPLTSSTPESLLCFFNNSSGSGRFCKYSINVSLIHFYYDSICFDPRDKYISHNKVSTRVINSILRPCTKYFFSYLEIFEGLWTFPPPSIKLQ